MINGNTDGVRNSIINRLEEIYNLKLAKYSILSEELFKIIVSVTIDLQREVSVAIDRKAQIINVSIGDSTTVELPLIDIKEKKLSGVRIIHTHPNGSSRLSALDTSALLKLKLDCIVAIGVDNEGYTDLTTGFCAVENDVLMFESMKPMSLEETIEYDFLHRIQYIEECIQKNELIEDQTERAILVGIDSEDSLIELKELAKACNIEVVNIILQKRSKVDTAYYIGKGKVEEIAMIRQVQKANMAIFDDELYGSQTRNLEEALGMKVIDRTTLILEIFARRAKSREAKLQVEAAQMKYRLPRLSGLGSVLSRTGGGIGTRGPGEKKLEIDRRRIRERLHDLQQELEKVKKVREVQRDRRNSSDIPQVSLVGYTNAGKSTLRNTLCSIAMPKDATIKDDVFEADMLFATLDVTTRAIVLPDNRLITLTDTVGFIKKLPHDLVEAFKSTLEEVVFSDLLVHVVDASIDKSLEQIIAVKAVLQELGASNKPELLVLNKVDKTDEDKLNEIETKFSSMKIIRISAKQQINLDVLLQEISNTLPNTLRKVQYLIPYTEQAIVAMLHRNSKVEVEDFREEGTFIEALVDAEVYNKCIKYLVK